MFFHLMKRSSEGVERTIKHEKEHASHFKSAFEEIWSLADAERGGYGVDMSREEAERISKAISTKLHNRGAYNIIWENKVKEENEHAGDAWKEWYEKNGPAIP